MEFNNDTHNQSSSVGDKYFYFKGRISMQSPGWVLLCKSCCPLTHRDLPDCTRVLRLKVCTTRPGRSLVYFSNSVIAIPRLRDLFKPLVCIIHGSRERREVCKYSV